MALQKGQRLREVGQFEVAEVGQIKSAGDIAAAVDAHRRAGGAYVVIDNATSAHAPRRQLGV
ncbi:hypothetical protein NX80_008145 [Xanthomonas vasicola pv. arecae]|uniref:hypothetical protein n=1 Tax=Xanthomonas vasicola TaxID=56459 RepID=UPI000F854E50|nr:hypothetical protein [Xanthomonas vasicola]AZR26468.1 hypothetical protein NX80_008145 [Xanthomonas vasicola pv. arecae]